MTRATPRRERARRQLFSRREVPPSRQSGPARSVYLGHIGQPHIRGKTPTSEGRPRTTTPAQDTALYDAALETLPIGVLVVDSDRVVRSVNSTARHLLGLPADLAAPRIVDLPPTGVGACLDTLIEEVSKSGMQVRLERLDVPRGVRAPDVSVEASPVLADGKVVGTTLLVLRQRPRATDELESTNTELRGQKDELTYINRELRQRTDELNQIAVFLESILTSLHGAVVVVDTEMVVRMWNPRAADLWGIRGREAHGSRLVDLPLGMLATDLEAILRGGLAGGLGHHDVEIDAPDGHVRARLTCTPLRGAGGEVRGVILLFERQG